MTDKHIEEFTQLETFRFAYMRVPAQAATLHAFAGMIAGYGRLGFRVAVMASRKNW